jgi:prophage maintenance system killer protein
MKHGPGHFFDIENISQNYELVIADFDRINKIIRCKRDKFDRAIAGNMLHAYNHINNLLAAAPEKAILSWQDMLELNIVVHLGIQPETREEYYGFVRHTEEKFGKQLPPLMKWYDRHEHNEDDPYKIAAGLYVRVLSEPQLFIEGNHRTGSLIANYYLLMKGEAPFVLTPQNAVEFFDLASDVKFQKQDIGSKFKRAIGWHDELARMRAFLEANVRPFTTDAMPKWTPPPQERPEDKNILKMLHWHKTVTKLL